MTLIIQRRSFLRGLLVGSVLVGAPRLLEASTLQREPYVLPGETVSDISLNLYPAPGFIGTCRVVSVGEWDGKAYPVTLDMGGYRAVRETQVFPDTSLCNFLRELPERFWHSRTVGEWPNVHSWVRHRRYGESPDVMRAKMRAAAENLPWPGREVPA